MSTEVPVSPARRNAAALLWAAADRAPDAAAFVSADGCVAYAAMAGRAGAFARALREAGVRRGDRVAVLLERGPDAAAAWFGAAAAGAVGVLVNDALRPRQVEHVLRDTGASTLISAASVTARQPRPLRTAARVLDAARISVEEAWTPADADDGVPAQIIYTSGSTGLPKGVLLSHGNLRACAAAVSGYLGLRADDRTASLLPFSSVYGFNQLLCAVATGGALVVEVSPLASRIVRTLAEREVTVLAAVPPLWHALLRAPEFRAPLPALRVMQNAGGHLPRESAALLRTLHPRAALFLMYGMTEVMRSTYLPPEQAEARPGSIGRAIPGAVVDVLRPDGEPCGTGELGELVHRGPTVALGYWNRPAATADAFRPAAGGARAVRSGDVVRRDADDFLYYVGRRDRVIKSLGYRVGPDEVADVLFASGQVAEAVVRGEPDAARGERIIAHVVLWPDGSADALRDFCRMEMPRWMHPAHVDFRRDLPRTPAGKYDVQALRRIPLPASNPADAARSGSARADGDLAPASTDSALPMRPTSNESRPPSTDSAVARSASDESAVAARPASISPAVARSASNESAVAARPASTDSAVAPSASKESAVPARFASTRPAVPAPPA